MKIGETDAFELVYMTQFRAIAARHGIFVEYALDRSAHDIGLRLTQPVESGRIVTPALVWFQMKGVMTKTLSRVSFEKTEEVVLTLRTDHLRFWYTAIQPTYLVVYVQSVNQFFAIDIKEWVRREFGEEILVRREKTTTVRVHRKNLLDDDFFRSILNKNLIPALRERFGKEGDEQIARFLRDSSLIKWLAKSRQSGVQTRMRVVKWVSKMRTEVYFESRKGDGEWELLRTHWQYSMEDITVAFPFLTMVPRVKAALERYLADHYEDSDGHEQEIWEEKISIFENDDDLVDDEDIDGEGLLAIGDNEYSYAEVGGGEMSEHEIAIALNEVGERWAKMIDVLEQAEIIAVDVTPDYLSVAPWHERDI